MQSDKPDSEPKTKETLRGFEGLPADVTSRIKDAVAYIDAVKARFEKDRPEVYSKFLDLMKDFREQRIDTIGVTTHITTLFEGHPDLITSFEKFSPLGSPAVDSTAKPVTKEKESESGDHSEGPSTAGLGYGLQLGTSTPVHAVVDETSKVTVKPTIEYLQRVKQQCNAATWEQFVDILARQWKSPGTVDEEEMIRDVEKIFEGHPELIPGFRPFLAEAKVEKATSQSNLPKKASDN